MSTVTDILSVIFIVALIIIVAPQLFELLAFVFVIFLQIMLWYMIAQFIFSVLRSFASEEEGQRAYRF